MREKGKGKEKEYDHESLKGWPKAHKRFLELEKRAKKELGKA